MRAVLADGRVLEFPNGTDPAVIQRTVKSLLKPPEEKHDPAVEKFQQEVRADLAKGGRTLMPMSQKEKQEVASDYSKAKKVFGQLNEMKGDASELGLLLPMAGSAGAPGAALAKGAMAVAPAAGGAAAGAALDGVTGAFGGGLLGTAAKYGGKWALKKLLDRGAAGQVAEKAAAPAAEAVAPLGRTAAATRAAAQRAAAEKAFSPEEQLRMQIQKSLQNNAQAARQNAIPSPAAEPPPAVPAGGQTFQEPSAGALEASRGWRGAQP